jgi:hypothetical protein
VEIGMLIDKVSNRGSLATGNAPPHRGNDGEVVLRHVTMEKLLAHRASSGVALRP